MGIDGLDDLKIDAEDLAEKRGCVLENDCWPQCVEVAQEDIDLVDALLNKLESTDE